MVDVGYRIDGPDQIGKGVRASSNPAHRFVVEWPQDDLVGVAL
jgi:hypothetical protein